MAKKAEREIQRYYKEMDSEDVRMLKKLKHTNIHKVEM